MIYNEELAKLVSENLDIKKEENEKRKKEDERLQEEFRNNLKKQKTYQSLCKKYQRY